MLFVKRFCASHLKISKMSHRFRNKKRPDAPLGSRILLDPNKVFDHNMWDHMQWSQEEEERAKEKAIENSLVRVQPELQAKYEREASRYWNEFYKIHKNNFFKDRKWLFLEFSEILPEGKSGLCRKVAATTNSRCTGLLEDSNLCEDNSVVKTSSVLSTCYDNSTADEQIVKSTGKQFLGSEAAYRILEKLNGDLYRGNWDCCLRTTFPCDTDKWNRKVSSGNIPSQVTVSTQSHHPSVFLYCCDFASEAVEIVKSHPLIDSSRCFAFVHDVCNDASPYPFPDDSLDVVLLVFVLSSIHPDRIRGVVNRLARLLKPGGMILFRDYGRYDASQLRFKKDEIRSIFSSAGLTEVQNLLDRRLQVNRKKKVKIQRVWIQSKFQKQWEPTQE